MHCNKNRSRTAARVKHIAISSLLLTFTGAAFTQSIPNPFLAPVQAPPPLQGTPPNGTPPLPEPEAEPTPSVFHPYNLAPIAVGLPNEPLAPVPITMFDFEPEELLPLPDPERSPPEEAPTLQETPEPSVGKPDLVGGEPAPEAVPQEGEEEPGREPVAREETEVDVVHVLGITTGAQPAALLSINGTTGPYRVGDTLPNGYTITDIDPTSITFNVNSSTNATLENAEGNDEAGNTPATLRVNIR